MDVKHFEYADASPAKTPDPPFGKELSASSLTADDLASTKAPLEGTTPTNADGFASLARLRKNLLFVVVTIAMATDTLGTSCLFVSTEEIARNMGLSEGGNAIWIISAYAMAFAACIPLGGRLCDVLPAQWSFLGGFVAMTGLTLGNSFGERLPAFTLSNGWLILLPSQ